MYSSISGGIQIEFPYRESRYDNFIQYDNGRIAFDLWYPSETYLKLVEIAQSMILEYKEKKEIL